MFFLIYQKFNENICKYKDKYMHTTPKIRHYAKPIFVFYSVVVLYGYISKFIYIDLENVYNSSIK